MLLADSLINGFLGSNLMGKGLVVVQLLGSVVMLAVIIGKAKELQFLSIVTRRFLRDFMSTPGVLDYYMNRRPSADSVGVVSVYAQTCERLLTLLTPDVRALVAARQCDGNGDAALTEREVKLVQSTCDHVLEDEAIKVEHGMGVIATVVSLEPMLGLLGTVWGVLDAFAEMGTAGSANLATIAPSISAALVTTVVGLLIAIPGVIAFARMNATIRNLTADMEGFADELNGRIACEYQGRGA
jgi:biopolymer transport protein ExbB/TolQ